MGRVTAIDIPGLDLWFNSSDHLPPHFHARKAGEWEIRVQILETTEDGLAYSIKWPKNGARIPGKALRALHQATLEHRDALLVEWEQKVLVTEDL